MKRLAFILMTFVALACVMTSCGDDLEHDSSGKISGIVIDMDSGEPIQGALITISPSNASSPSIYSGYDGHFEFLGLYADNYRLSVQKTGYRANYRDVIIKAGEYVTVSLVMQKIE